MSPPRLAAGRARTLGSPTRGTTGPNRLRRVDRYLVAAAGPLLRAGPAPLVIDVGFGSSPVTTVELAHRLRAVRPDVEVVGVEIDPTRVAAAQPLAEAGLRFVHGGFELAGLGAAPVVIRVMNVLRQYPVAAVQPAWDQLALRLAPEGLLVEGTCDELGRRAAWVTLRPSPAGAQAQRLTLAWHLPSLEQPSEIAARLPKALIETNVAGQPVHALLTDLDQAWARERPRAVHGSAQRFLVAVQRLAAAGAWPIERRPPLGGPRRWRLGELSLPWSAVAPTADGPGRSGPTWARRQT